METNDAHERSCRKNISLAWTLQNAGEEGENKRYLSCKSQHGNLRQSEKLSSVFDKIHFRKS